MAEIKGPFDLQYGLTTLADIEKVDVKYSVDTDDKVTVQGRKRRFYGTHQVIITVTFLKSDVPSLAVVLPQYHVANGGTLSSGETVTDIDGAMDLVPGGCTAGTTMADLIISSCGSDGQIFRVMDCVTEFSNMTMDDKSMTVDVEFVGQGDAATIQMFKKGAISLVS
jgi:hypothetical protein